MAKSKKKRPTWFKIHLENKRTFDNTPNEQLGAALKLALQYFDAVGNGENKAAEQIVAESKKDIAIDYAFDALLTGIYESFQDYKQSVESGSKGAAARAANAASANALDTAMKKYGTPEPAPQETSFWESMGY